MKIKFVAIFLTALLGMQHSFASTKMPFPEIWFQGSVEDAFSKAEAENKFVFLYWGATWCPPCNSLKSAVFSQEKFKELAKNVVPYYLDGDVEMSQKWGEQFKISGYPTILLMTAKQKEIMRISTAMNIDEFEKTFQSSIKSEKTTLERVEALLAGKGNEADWHVVARSDNWRVEDNKNWNEDQAFKAKVELFNKVPAQLKEEKLLLSAQLLGELAMLKEKSSPDVKKLASTFDDKAYSLAMGIVANKENILATRTYMIYLTKEIFSYVSKDADKKQMQILKEKWLAGAKILDTDTSVSIEDRYSSVMPYMAIYEFENPKSETYPEEIKAMLVKNSSRALKEIENDYYLKHSLIPSIAYYLANIGEFEMSRKILLDEIKVTDTPWYYQSSLAGVEEKAKNIEQSLYWSEQAKNSASGKSTKLQWIRSDTYRMAKFLQKDRLPKIKNNLKEYYELAFSLEDGFTGRNGKGFFTFLNEIKDEKEKKELSKEFKKYQNKCGSLKGEYSKNCKQYFEEVLKVKVG